MEIPEDRIPLGIWELLSVMKGALNNHDGLVIKGYDFRPDLQYPFYGIWPRGSSNSLATVAVQGNKEPYSLRLTMSNLLNAPERKSLQHSVKEFCEKQRYELVP